MILHTTDRIPQHLHQRLHQTKIAVIQEAEVTRTCTSSASLPHTIPRYYSPSITASQTQTASPSTWFPSTSVHPSHSTTHPSFLFRPSSSDLSPNAAQPNPSTRSKLSSDPTAPQTNAVGNGGRESGVCVGLPFRSSRAINSSSSAD